MELLTIILSAGESKRFEKSGRYFEIIDSAAPVRVDFYSASGQQTDQMLNALSGLFLEAAYGAFTISSSTAQSVSFLLLEQGRGGSRRQPGSVRVINEITDALTLYSPAGLVMTPQAFNATALVLPAANVRGIVVRYASASAQAGAGGAASVGIVAAKSAPTGYATPLNRYPVIGSYSQNAVLIDKSIDVNKLIPAGWGLYSYAEVVGVNATLLAVNVGIEVQ